MTDNVTPAETPDAKKDRTMTAGHYVAIVVGAVGALAAYLASAIPGDASLFQAIAGGAAALGPIFAAFTPKAGA